MLRVCFGGRCQWHSCLISHDVMNWNRNLEGKRRGERIQKKIILKKDRSWVWEDGWGEKCLVLFQRTRVSGSLQRQHQHREAHNCLVLQLKIIRSPQLVSVGTTLTCTACTAQTWLKIKEGQLQLTSCSPNRDWCREALREIQFIEELTNLHCSSSKWIIKCCKTREGVVRS